ncbi:chemotaxis protein CheA, partial [uncultured Pseudacidovorax sp.]|uniref:chemotaxis protein CheA n=1 Tax=uncultured Pseudacidovorax sp. TaxID=679313 RepID=UPI0025E5C9B3
MKVDLGEFVGIFVEEAREHLDVMESLLLALDPQQVDGETLNALFRAAHSIKGGAATFGLDEVTRLAHVAESLLDRVRDRRVALTPEIVDALLVADDVMRAQIAAFEGQPPVPAADVEAVRARLAALADTAGTPPMTPEACAPAPAPASAPTAVDAASAQAGTIKGEGVDFGFFDDEPGVGAEREAAAPAADPAPLLPPPPPPPEANAPAAAPVLPAMAAGAPASPAAALHESSSIRVSVDKVDQIINLVGELVIIQSMLAQHAQSETPQQVERLRSGLDLLDRNTRGLQEAAMAIRMMPISAVFNRFPRLARDLAQRLGKEVEIRLEGEGTELDKGLIERIVDPLTHLVRNSLDHGIESPAERIALGKPAFGTITLRASHQGGNIVIEVSDDGRGLSRERILAKARERGIPVAENPSDAEVWNLIFEPGFSTAAQVTD